MTAPLARIQRAARRLGFLLLAEAALVGVAVAVGILLLGALLRWSMGAGAPSIPVPPVAASAGMLAAALVLWLGRGVHEPGRVALWVEEHQPGLDYALITAVELERGGHHPGPDLLATATAAEVERIVSDAGLHLLRSSVPWLLGIGVGTALAGYLAAGARRTEVGLPSPAAASRLSPLSAELVPPAYTGWKATRESEPSRLRGLAGSQLVLRGSGAAGGIRARIGPDTVPASGGMEGWSVQLRLPVNPVVLVLEDRSYRRVVSLEPRPDSVPEALLIQPAHDTSYLDLPTRPLEFEARLSDDIGLGSGYWEYLITTTGGGEEYRSEMRKGPRVNLGGGRLGVLRAALRLDTLRLTPGSVVSIRAVVFDWNDLTGPGRGVSETRTLRLLEAQDSSAVGAEPPIPIDSMWLSQRLLNLRADTLRGRRRQLADTALGSRSMTLSNGQQAIRERVVAVIALLEDDGVGGLAPTDESRLLREAATAMLDARLRLASVQLDSARPPMTRALAILDEIRTARRYHLRGVLRPTPVDVARARLTGLEHGNPGGVAPLPPPPDADRQLADRLSRLTGAVLSREALRDSVTFFRAEVLRRNPALAAALDSALIRLARRATPLEALAPARRLLARSPVVIRSAMEWQGGGP